MSEIEDRGLFGKVFNKTLYRRGREVDLANVPAEKLQKAAEERGVRIEITELEGDRGRAQVNKVAVEGDDEVSGPSE